jgi:hypothetical protein
MSTFVDKDHGLQIRCESCAHSYPWNQNCKGVPYSVGEGPTLQARISYEVRCPRCDCLEAKWNLGAR